MSATRSPRRVSKPAAIPFSAAAAKLIEQLQDEARAQVLSDLSTQENVVLLLEHTNVKVEFDDLNSAYYLHAKSESYAITLYRGRPDATAKYPQTDGVWWGNESRADIHGVIWQRKCRGLVCNDFGDLVQVAA